MLKVQDNINNTPHSNVKYFVVNLLACIAYLIEAGVHDSPSDSCVLKGILS